MDADWSVEIGGDAPALEFPWRSPDEHGLRYLDLKRHPELLDEIQEAVRYPELREFLHMLNLPGLPLQTAKCDVWTTDELNADEEIYGATRKLGCYIDLLFAEESARFSFARHEAFARGLAAELARGPDIPATAEIIVRRCYYRGGSEQEGHYFTLYVHGYGRDETEARSRWSAGLRMTQSALLCIPQ